jgi:solute:Na+ symporter, SSS family
MPVLHPMPLEYITLGVYFGFLLLLGGVFARFNKNLSDFARGGAQLTWWMVGMSILMAGISAFTFTGNASSAFEAGPSLLVIYVANVLGFALGWLYLARRYRQTRAYTTADVIRGRFGTGAEQFGIYLGLLLGPLSSAVQLWALGVFVSSVFGFPLLGTIIAIGVITVFYSASGGAWAVIATDFVQGVVLFGITLLVGILAYVEIGGVSGFLSHLSDPRLAADFAWIKPSGQFPSDRYTWSWAFAIFAMQFIGQINLGSAGRYLAVKDGREASRAALMGMILMAVGSFIWFLPPMVARFLYEAEVLGSGIKDPATTAYAVIARHLLPDGLMGVLIAAMFAATMSSMDSGLNGQTSGIVRNLLPRLRSVLGLPPLREGTQVRLCRFISVGLGALIILAALLLSTQTRVVLFDAFLTIGSVIGAPLGLPLLVGIIFRRLPGWSYFFIFGGSLLPSIYSFIDEKTGGAGWTIQQRALWVLAFGLGATVLCLALARFSPASSRRRTDEFFAQMETPVDFAREVGESRDWVQALLLGRSVTAMGTLLLGFLLVPNSLPARLQVLALACFTLAIGGGLWLAGVRGRRRETEAATVAPSPVTLGEPAPAPITR